jgi:hypothetical protein
VEQGSFKYRTENYYGSKKKVHTVSWHGRGEVDTSEIRDWCVENFGKAGYQEEHGEARWLDDTDDATIFLCRDEDLTFFLLKWT